MNAPATAPAMKPRERQALDAQLAGERPRLLLRTRTRIDTGRWLGRSPIWLCVADTKLVLLAVSKRGYTQQSALPDCSDAWYCHTTGQLVLEPAPGLRFSRLSLTPEDALRVLHLIEQGTPHGSPTQANATENNGA